MGSVIPNSSRIPAKSSAKSRIVTVPVLDGPAGAGDRYLQIRAAGGNLGTDNSAQWAGDYLGAGDVAARSRTVVCGTVFLSS